MLTILTATIGWLFPYLIAGAAAVVAVGGAWFHGKSTGKSEVEDRERMRRLEQAAAVAEAERRAPRARAPRVKRLRDGSA